MGEIAGRENAVSGGHPLHPDRFAFAGKLAGIAPEDWCTHSSRQMQSPLGMENRPFLSLPESRRRLLALPPEGDETLSPIPVKSCHDLGITSYYTTPLSLEDLSSALLPALESHQLQPGDAGKS